MEQREALGAGVGGGALDERAAGPAPVLAWQHGHHVDLERVSACRLQREKAHGRPATLGDERGQLVGGAGVLDDRPLDAEPVGQGAQDAFGERALTAAAVPGS